MKLTYSKAFQILKAGPSATRFSLGKEEGRKAFYAAFFNNLKSFKITLTKRQFGYLLFGPMDGYWTLMQQAEYLSKVAKVGTK